MVWNTGLGELPNLCNNILAILDICQKTFIMWHIILIRLNQRLSTATVYDYIDRARWE